MQFGNFTTMTGKEHLSLGEPIKTKMHVYKNEPFELARFVEKELNAYIWSEKRTENPRKTFREIFQWAILALDEHT